MVPTQAQTAAQLEEHQLIEQARQDPAAFGQLYSRHHGAIFGYVLKRVADVRLAEDLTSHVFLTAYEKLWTFRWRGVPFSAWLYRIAGNAIAMHFRGSRKHLLSLDALMADTNMEPQDPHDLAAELLEAETALERAHELIRAQRLLVTLPPRYQEALALRYLEDKSLNDVAQILGKPLGTVKSLVSRGLEKLRAALEADAATSAPQSAAQPIADPSIVEAEGTTLTS